MTSISRQICLVCAAVTRCRGLGVIMLALLATVLLEPLSARGQVQRSMPANSYFARFSTLHNGDYKDALAGFQDELRGGVRTVQSRWIDSICYYTMVGECHYKLGQYNEALDNYIAALNLYVAFSNWMVQVQFPPSVAGANVRQPLPWGKSARNTKLGRFSTMLIQQGRPVTEGAIRRGGVIAPPTLHSIRPDEIVRCTCLAMKRRAELLGPLCQHDPLTDRVLTVAQSGGGVPNHWSEAWLDVQLGFASAAAGNVGQAVAKLQQSLLVAGEFDHPITGLALLELGRLNLEAGKLQAAAKFFEEASYTAAEHDDLTVLDEAFRYGAMIHAMQQPKDVFAPLEPAAAWATKRGGREFQISLVLLAAESAAQVGQTRQAMALLNQAKTQLGKRIMSVCEIGARLNHISAMVQYQSGNVPVGDEALAAALKINKNHCLWLYQLALTSSRLAKKGITASDAVEIFEKLADDPIAADWLTRPLACLSVLSTPHHGVYEQWFESTHDRDLEAALEVADRARRHRFFSALPLGGRLLALRWLLESPVESLDETSRIQRQDLLTRYPRYAELARQASALLADLEKMPLVISKENTDDHRRQSQLFDELAKVATSQEILLREIAVRREPAAFVFPPLRQTKEIQQMLPPGTVLLHVFQANRQTYATLLAKERYANWRVENSSAFEKKLAGMLRAMGNYDPNRELPQNQLNDHAWKQPAKEAIDLLLAGSKVNFGQKFEELVIIPDGMLWYLPFEAVQVGEAKKTVSLLSKTRIRYAPTLGLAFTSGPARRVESARIGVVLGKLAPRDELAESEAFVARLQSSMPKSGALYGALVAPSPYYGALVDGLVVLDDVANRDQGPLDWSPIPLDKQKAAGALANWLALPWKSVDVIAVPGFHTPAESGLKETTSAPGQDLFLASCGLMATGARTVLLSRWRTGGQTSRDLVRQFVQELPYSSAASAWQRSVQLMMETPIDVAHEPRIKSVPTATESNASHPFLWAGYMVIDSGIVPAGHEPQAEELQQVKAAANGNQAAGKENGEGAVRAAADPATKNGAADEKKQPNGAGKKSDDEANVDAAAGAKLSIDEIIGINRDAVKDPSVKADRVKTKDR